MTLVVENGTGLANAESYVSVSAADTYHSNRGNTAWAALATPAKEAALRKATDYIGQAYGHRFKGYRSTKTQALDFPRTELPIPGDPDGDFYATSAIPAALSNACFELALRASSASLLADTSQAIKREKVGQLETEYQDFTVPGVRYPAVDGLLLPLCGGRGLRLSKA